MPDSCFVYILKPTRLEMLTHGPTDEEAVILGEHVDYLAKLAEAGTLLLAGRTQNNDADTMGLVIFEAEPDRAQRILDEDPAVRGGVMTATLYPYRVAVLGKALLKGFAD